MFGVKLKGLNLGLNFRSGPKVVLGSKLNFESTFRLPIIP